MNGLERMLLALQLSEPDRVPIWELIINEPVIRAIAGNVSRLDFFEMEDLDGVTVHEDISVVKWLDKQTYVDEWGIRWGVEPTGLTYPVGGPINDLDDLDGYSAPDPESDTRLATLEEAVRRFKGERAIVFLCHEAFEFSHYLRGGLKNLLVDYYRRKSLARRLAKIIIRYKTQVLKRAIDLGADVALTGDDYCNRVGPLMSVDHFKEFVLPYLQKMVDTAHRRGVPFIKHTDGNIWPILDLLEKSGIDAIDPLEPIAGMDIAKVKEKYGDRLCLVGNIDCGELLSMGTPEEVRLTVRKTILSAAPGGGYILSSSNSIHPAVRPENYLAMVAAARRWGAYRQ